MAKKRIWVWILLPVVVFAAVTLGEYLFQRDLPDKAYQQVVELPVSAETLEVSAPESSEDEYTEEEWTEDEEEAEGVTIPGGGSASYVWPEGKPVPLCYLQYLTITGESQASDGRYTVSGEDENGNSFSVTSFLGGDGVDTVYIGRKTDTFTIRIHDTGCVITGLAVDNTLHLNPVRMLFIGLCVLAVYLLIALREHIAAHAETGYLIIALCVGLFLCVALPPNTGVSYDDGVHYGRIQQLSRGKDTGMTAAENNLAGWDWTVIFNNGYHHTWDTLPDQERYAAMAEDAAQDHELSSTQTIQWIFSDVGYVTQAVGAALSRLVGLPFLWQVRVIRLFNMLTYVGLTWLAIRTLKRFKLTMACAALMPSALFTACNFSYDPTTNALCFLGIALAVDAMLDRRVLLTRRRGAAILLCLLLGAMSKVVYMPLLLLVLLLPRGKFESRAARWWFKTLSVVLCVAAIGAMVLSVNTGAVALQDTRADGADSAGQIAYLLTHPLTYLGTFFKVIIRDFETYFIRSCRFDLAYLPAVTGPVSLVCLGLTLFTAFTDNDTSLGQKMTWKLRLGMLIIAGLAVGMVFTTMYVAGAPVGATEFWGVQGRYMIPVIPLMLMVLSPDGIQNRMNKKGWHCLFFLIQGAILGTMCFGTVFQGYWL